MSNDITREDLIQTYRTYGSFTKCAQALGISRKKFAVLWQKCVSVDPSVYKKIVPHRFGVVCDTHIGSVKQQLTSLVDFYRYARRCGCEYIIHAGDLTDGAVRSKAGDKFIAGVDALIDYVCDVYPRDLPTYLISGNHDAEFVHYLGVDICEEICCERSDIHYIGSRFGRAYLNGISILVSHVSNVSRYRSEFRNSKLVINGHVHRFSMTRNNHDVLILNAPCLCNDINSDIGALIIEIDCCANESVKYVHYNVIDGDY